MALSMYVRLTEDASIDGQHDTGHCKCSGENV